MSYYINLQKSIDFIEENLTEDIGLDQIAGAAGYSIPHFYRVFGAIVGCSVMEYVRRRRLSNAMFDIVTTGRSILDIAFDYGFESHEVFTRTFKLAYGAPPSSFRKAPVEPRLYEKANLLFKMNQIGEIIMKPEIVCKEEKLLVGIARRINQQENVKNGLLQKVKEEFVSAAGRIKHRINPDLYYAVYDYNAEDIKKEDDQINYTYYYCVEVSEYGDIPSGMVKKAVPKAKYAVFHFDTVNRTLNGERMEMPVYDYIDGVWLPNSGFELSEASDFEVFHEKENWIDFYISVK
jgi:AraC family transcriptional regulator